MFRPLSRRARRGSSLGVRILGIGDYNDFGSLYLRLADEGHEVRVHISQADSGDVLQGMIATTPDWRRELAWIRGAGDDGLIIFEEAGKGTLQDSLRADGYRVIGGSAYGDRLEQERAFGQQILRDAGMQIAPAVPFTDFDTAIAHIRATPGRYVVKFDGSFLTSDVNFVGRTGDGSDVIAVLERHRRTWDEDYDEPPAFILMRHVAGIETGLGAFFNGREFVEPINLDWEHKRLFPGDLGELTGEMGTVVTYRDGDKLFEATLGRLAPVLRDAHHVGYMNLNTIINDDGVWPLELTCRFGYPGFAILSALFDEPCADILARIAAGSSEPLRTHAGFAVGVVLTVPPFPYHHGYDELSKGARVVLPDELTADERRNLHLGEVGRVDGELVMTGQTGYAMVVTGRGDTIEQAQQAAYALAAKVSIANVRYRNDIGDKLRDGGYATLQRLGWV